MKKSLYRLLLIAMGLTLLLCLLVYPLLLPTENYFRLVLQLIPMSLVTGVLMIFPIWLICDKYSKEFSRNLKNIRLDSDFAVKQFPELKPLARQVSNLRAQIDTQMNSLSGQQEQLRVLTDNMHEGLLLVSAAGRVLSYNQAALSLLDKTLPESDYPSVYALCDSAALRRLVNQVLDGIRGEATIRIHKTAVQIMANPIVRDNRLAGAALILLDVTEREKRNAEYRDFTVSAAQQLQQPVDNIREISDFLESGAVKKKDTPAYTGKIHAQTDYISALIEDITSLMRFDHDSFTEEMTEIDLYDIAEDVMNSLQNTAEAMHVTVTLEGTSAPMQGVPEMAAEMLRNLLENAIRYNVENGTVKMKITGTDQQTVFTITDTGIGIEPEAKAHIFERFFRSDSAAEKAENGTGLGLSIVRCAAEFHQATIEVDSQPGNGSVFTLFFPRSAEAAAAAESEALFDPLNIEIPGEPDAPMIQIRGDASQYDDDDALYISYDDEDDDEDYDADIEPDDEDYDIDTEPDDEDYDIDTEPDEDYDTDIEPDDEYDTDTEPDDEYDIDTEPDDEYDTDTEPDEDYDTDTEPDEDYDIDTEPDEDYDIDTEPDDEYDTDANEPDRFYEEDDEPDADDDDDTEEIRPEPEPERAPRRRIDVVPIDENTMDISI